MNLRKYLVAGAAVLAAGLLAIPSAAHATGGGPVAGVKVGGVTPTSPAAISGAFKSGTATFAGFTASCSSGSVGGTVGTSAAFSFNSLNITCDSPLGIDANITLASGCTIGASATGTVHDGLVDGVDPKGGKYDPVEFNAATVNTNCVVVTIDGGCTFRVDGTMGLQFIEPLKTVSSSTFQEIVLKGSGLQTRGANFLCFGLIPNGSVITLNNIAFNIPRTTANAIDFHP